MTVKLSPKYGLNPCITKCFWCGKDTGIALLGRIRSRKGARDDIEAPKEAVVTLEPCEECEQKFSQGVLFIEVKDEATMVNMPIKDASGNLMYPTGRFACIKPEVVKGKKAGDTVLCDSYIMDKLLAGT